MQKVEFTCPVNAGRIPVEVSQNLRSTLEKLNGKTAKITIQEKRKTRSLSQNAFYFGVVIPAIQHMFFEAGQPVDEQVVHEYLKRHVGNLTRTLQTPDGKQAAVTRSSTELDTIEWELFIEQIRAWAAQWNTEVPFPNEGLTYGTCPAFNSKK